MDLGGSMKGAIVATVAVVVVLLLGSALMPGAITAVSNTTAITGFTANSTLTGGYSGWSSSTQTTWNAIGIFGVLAFFLVLVAIIIKLVE